MHEIDHPHTAPTTTLRILSVPEQMGSIHDTHSHQVPTVPLMYALLNKLLLYRDMEYTTQPISGPGSTTRTCWKEKGRNYLCHLSSAPKQ